MLLLIQHQVFVLCKATPAKLKNLALFARVLCVWPQPEAKLNQLQVDQKFEMLRGLQASWRSCSIEKIVFAELCSTTGILVAELFCFLGILQKINVGHTLGNKRGEQFGQQRNPAATTTRQQICR